MFYVYPTIYTGTDPANIYFRFRLDAYYKTGFTYSSNALEGNSLTLSEAKVLLEDGITVDGKPIRDCYEATGHAKDVRHCRYRSKKDRQLPD